MNSTVIEKSVLRKHSNPRTNFSSVTEMPGSRASREQLSMLYTRYRFASSFCKGQEVLEVGCGAGLGLGYLARFAKKVTGVDIDEQNLKAAKVHYQGRDNIALCKMDAHELSFENRSFDVVILFEAIYYLAQPQLFLAECRRLLRQGGILLLNTVNPEWSDFNPSPFSKRYFSAREVCRLLESCGFEVQLYGAFPALDSSWKSKGISFLKRSARDLGLIPRTMRGKEFLKRVFFGRLVSMPAELNDVLAEYTPVVPVSLGSPVREYKILYTVAKKQER